MIEVAQELASHSPARGRLSFSRVETIERLPYSAESFDGVLCSSVLEYLPEPDAALREIVRVLKPGGLVLVSVPNAASRARKWIRWMDRGSRLLGKSLYPFIEHSRNEYTRTQFEEVLRTFGFRTEEAILFGTVYLPFHLRVEHSDTLMFFRAVKSGLA
jgi:2-polyprenyl-6-hydroxyphenyl methylase/3-demethylubiquinone-9 3-methyltransferase